MTDSRRLLLGLALCLAAVSCNNLVNVIPEGSREGRLLAQAGVDVTVVLDDTLTLSGSAEDGTPPYMYRWTVERTPEGGEDLVLFDPTAANAVTSPLDVEGEYTFRLLVVDAANSNAIDRIIVTVSEDGPVVENPEVTIDGPTEIDLDEAGTLTATATGDGTYTYAWEVVSGEGVTLSAPDEAETGIEVSEANTVIVKVTVTDADTGGSDSAEWTIEVLDPNAFGVTIDAPDEVADDQLFQASATVRNGSGDYGYVWSVIEGDATLENPDRASVTIRQAQAGELVIEVAVTDKETDERVTAEYTITVEASENPILVEVDGSDIAKVGESVTLSIAYTEESPSDFDRITYVWEVMSGTAELDDTISSAPVVTPQAGETTHVRLKVWGEIGDDTRAGAADFYLVSYDEDRPEVVFSVADYGDIVFELRPDVAPKTVANLLRYVDDGFYDGIVIHRVVPDFVIQGGGYVVTEDGELEKLETRDPVESESDNGLTNARGTVAMALVGSDLDSGTSQWFINLVDNNADGTTDLDASGFTVFATVSEGMDLVDQIATVETTTRSGLQNAPLVNIVINEATRR